MNYNEKIEDILIDRQLLLERLKTSENKKVLDVYLKILESIKTKLNSYEIIDIANANQIIKELNEFIKPDLTFVDDLKEISVNEANYIMNAFNTAATVNLFSKLPTTSTLEKIANAELFQGATIKKTFANLDTNLKFNIEQQVKQGVVLGESIKEIRSRIVTLFNGKYTNDIERITRTAVHTVVNQAREALYNENRDVIRGYRHISTLDLRTSSICAIRDGKRWDIDKKPIGHDLVFMIPSLHISCRSLMTVYTKSYKELGISELSPATRASMNGQIPKDTTFNQWIKTKSKTQQEQWFGKGKFELYEQGKITLSDLVTNKNRPLTLAELKAKYD